MNYRFYNFLFKIIKFAKKFLIFINHLFFYNKLNIFQMIIESISKEIGRG